MPKAQQMNIPYILPISYHDVEQQMYLKGPSGNEKLTLNLCYIKSFECVLV